MQKLDRLGWAEGFSFTSFGVSIGARASTTEALRRVMQFIPPGWKKSRRRIVGRLYSLIGGENSRAGGLRRLSVLYGDFARLARDESLEPVLDAFETDLHRYVAANSRKMTFLHAGVVGWQGRAIVIPGRSFSGKTTVVRELLRLGATYYSDEFAVVDNRGRLHPFARPLGIRVKGSNSRMKCSAEELGAAVGMKPLQASLVVIGKYCKGRRWRPLPVSQGEAALELLANSIAIRTDPGLTMTRIKRLLANASYIKGDRGEAAEVAAKILDLSRPRQSLLCAQTGDGVRRLAKIAFGENSVPNF